MHRGYIIAIVAIGIAWVVSSKRKASAASSGTQPAPGGSSYYVDTYDTSGNVVRSYPNHAGFDAGYARVTSTEDGAASTVLFLDGNVQSYDGNNQPVGYLHSPTSKPVPTTPSDTNPVSTPSNDWQTMFQLNPGEQDSITVPGAN